MRDCQAGEIKENHLGGAVMKSSVLADSVPPFPTETFPFLSWPIIVSLTVDPTQE